MAKVAKEIIDILNHNQTTHNGPIPNTAYANRGKAALRLEFGAFMVNFSGYDYSTVIVTTSE